MDISSIATVVGSIKTALDALKFIEESKHAYLNAELKLKLVVITDALVNAETRIRELNQELDVELKLKWDEPRYWLITESVDDGPFCQKCYDVDRNLVRLIGDGNGRYECVACKNYYDTQARREKTDESIGNLKERKRRGYY